MPIDEALALLAKPIEEGVQWPHPLCPQCRQGHLAFDKPVEIENSNSARFHDHEAWDPEMVFGSFEVAAICSNSDCGQRTSAVGTYRVDISSEAAAKMSWDVPGTPWCAYYSAEYFSPPLELIRTPEAAPAGIQQGIARSSKVLFADPGLAATALRTAIERYLTSEGIPSRGVNGRFRSLDARINDWSAQTGKAEIANLFHAIRFVGNEGTHELSDLTASDVIKDAAILDEALHRLFHGPDIEAKAQAIIATRGHARL